MTVAFDGGEVGERSRGLDSGVRGGDGGKDPTKVVAVGRKILLARGAEELR